MTNDTVSHLRAELAAAAANLKQCEGAYKGLKAFRNNQPGLAFCAAQLLQAAAMLRDHAEQVVMIADVLDTTYSAMGEPQETDGVSVDGHLSEL